MSIRTFGICFQKGEYQGGELHPKLCQGHFRMWSHYKAEYCSFIILRILLLMLCCENCCSYKKLDAKSDMKAWLHFFWQLAYKKCITWPEEESIFTSCVEMVDIWSTLMSNYFIQFLLQHIFSIDFQFVKNKYQKVLKVMNHNIITQKYNVFIVNAIIMHFFKVLESCALRLMLMSSLIFSLRFINNVFVKVSKSYFQVILICVI